jgi:hypothetical protein
MLTKARKQEKFLQYETLAKGGVGMRNLYAKPDTETEEREKFVFLTFALYYAKISMITHR